MVRKRGVCGQAPDMRHTAGMPSRLYVDAPLHEGDELTLPDDAARHLQVLRLQPGDSVTLFNGLGGEWSCEVARMGTRQDVAVRIGAHHAVSRELGPRITLAVGMPANERMDNLVEKATELGAAVIQPLHCTRSVLKLVGERADKRRVHWQAVAIAAAEQSGRTAVPTVEPIRAFEAWLATVDTATEICHVLSLVSAAAPLGVAAGAVPICLLSGPEGGLDPREEALATARGFKPASLGPRTLRADTAPLAALARLAASGSPA
jgi:16S rRNA (uracil1498-N3)-methyltransferase